MHCTSSLAYYLWIKTSLWTKVTFLIFMLEQSKVAKEFRSEKPSPLLHQIQPDISRLFSNHRVTYCVSHSVNVKRAKTPIRLVFLPPLTLALSFQIYCRWGQITCYSQSTQIYGLWVSLSGQPALK